MKITTIVFLLISSLILFGCGKEEEKVAAPQTPAPAEKPMDKPAVVEKKLNKSYSKHRKKWQKSLSRPKKRSSR